MMNCPSTARPFSECCPRPARKPIARDLRRTGRGGNRGAPNPCRCRTIPQDRLRANIAPSHRE
eukprot:5781635-Pyramimonas_sp.AAC.1